MIRHNGIQSLDSYFLGKSTICLGRDVGSGGRGVFPEHEGLCASRFVCESRAKDGGISRARSGWIRNRD